MRLRLSLLAGALAAGTATAQAQPAQQIVDRIEQTRLLTPAQRRKLFCGWKNGLKKGRPHTWSKCVWVKNKSASSGASPSSALPR